MDSPWSTSEVVSVGLARSRKLNGGLIPMREVKAPDERALRAKGTPIGR